jgi:hypothetical protein
VAPPLLPHAMGTAMRFQSPVNRAWQAAAVTALILVILAAGLCAFDHIEGGTQHHHGMPQDLCFLVYLLPASVLLLGGFASFGAAPDLAGFALVSVPTSVLKPPPRSSPLA